MFDELSLLQLRSPQMLLETVQTALDELTARY